VGRLIASFPDAPYRSRPVHEQPRPLDRARFVATVIENVRQNDLGAIPILLIESFGHGQVVFSSSTWPDNPL